MKNKNAFAKRINKRIMQQRAFFPSSKLTISDQKTLNYLSSNINLEEILDLMIWSNYSRTKIKDHVK